MKTKSIALALACILLLALSVSGISEATPAEPVLQHVLLDFVDVAFPDDWYIFEYSDASLLLATDPDDMTKSVYIQLEISEPLELDFFDMYAESLIEMNAAQIESTFTVENLERISDDTVNGLYYIVTSPELDGISGGGMLIHGHYIVKLSLTTFDLSNSADDCLAALKQLSFTDLSLVK